jgi:hypothetical protein
MSATTRATSTAAQAKTVSAGTPKMALVGFGEKCTPQAPPWNDEGRPDPVKDAFGVARDGLRPPLTGPGRRAPGQQRSSYMQKWEYGYVYVATAQSGGSGVPLVRQQFIVLADVQGNRVLRNVLNRLGALNILGDLGWIISESPYVTWSGEGSGWLYDLVKEEKPDTTWVTINSIHFMRRPRDE